MDIKHKYTGKVLFTVPGDTLSGADLSGAYLSGADLSGANLSGAYLSGAYLSGAYLTNARLPTYQNIPEEGSFIGWKKLESGVLVKLEIPADAKRTSSLVGRKNRAEFAKVLEMTDRSGQQLTEGRSMHNFNFVYRVGETVYPDSYNGDIREECVNGIHFFITKQEALDY